MLKIDKSFFDVIDIARDLLGPPRDRDNVNPEYQRAVLELVAGLTVGTEEHARLFIADSLGVDHEIGSEPNNDITIPVDTLLEWAGPLTTAQVARLAEAIPHSSVPEAVATIADAIRDDDNGWRPRSPFRHDDSGDVGGDIQAGPAHSLSWQRELADHTFETLTLYHFAAKEDASRNLPQPASWSFWVETMIELVRHRDANDPGGTELAADYRYESRVSHATFTDALTAADRYTGDNEGTDPQTLWWQI